MPRNFSKNLPAVNVAEFVQWIEYAGEMATQSLARKKLIPFTRYTFLPAGGYNAYAVHDFIGEQFEHVERGDLRRVILSMPPQYGKSELASIRFPAWFLGRNPDKRIILASYGASLAQYFGGEIRNLVASTAYQELFPNIELRQDSKAKAEFYIANHRGGLVAAGVGGALTGRPADVAIIDDPIKDEATARSPRYRENLIMWYKTVLYTRLSPDAVVIVIGTRWHRDDLIGYLLNNSRESWTELTLSAKATDQDPMGRELNAPLCPERHSAAQLDTIEHEAGVYWLINWQQTPPDEVGAMFKRGWFDILDDLPPANQIIVDIRYWDLAVTRVETSINDPDYIVGTRLMIWQRGDDSEDIIIYDVADGQLDWGDSQDLIVTVAKSDGTAVPIVVEKAGQQGGLISDLRGLSALRGFTIDEHTPRGDKVLRAQPFAARAKARRVHLVRAAWNSRWLSWFEGFPLLSHDDHVDSAVTAYQYTGYDKIDWGNAVW